MKINRVLFVDYFKPWNEKGKFRKLPLKQNARSLCRFQNHKQPKKSTTANKCAYADIWSSTVTKGIADIAGYCLEILIQISHRAENCLHR